MSGTAVIRDEVVRDRLREAEDFLDPSTSQPSVHTINNTDVLVVTAHS
jgi:hypothetical protein